MTGKKILSVKIKREVDTDPDLSFLGEYSNSAGDNAIDREERGGRGHGEYRYFNCAMSGEDTGNPDSPEQDYKRAEAYNAQQWCMIGIWVEAEVILSGDTVQHIRSGGLWGIESDSGEDYFEEVQGEELSSLRDELEAIGFSKRQIDRAFKDVENDY